MQRQKGLTLVEMMIALAIMAILITVVAPNVQTILVQNRIVADINNLSAAIKHARFTAVDEQTDVTFCPTSNYSSCSSSWALAKMVFIDSNNNGQREDEETLIVSADPLSSSNKISGATGAVLFSANGGTDLNATVTICPNDGEVSLASALIVTLYGRVTTAQDSDNDGVKENNSGGALSCT
ncbi:GspH/FimT family pseudopilin [Alteromonas ponticola]|uniref:Type II secretion system protein H n=1 Tax=Alteromonas ponticola TaxID=2720613 RepID=A0ABX1QXH3_9ALTE|nr:GspH/FimT family pseudopilin [Alteromonas ponticola]NMH58950.1 prepilin-type N-terminal cleavage/methylation domain-containing protein [Alteromonas ponticola]